MLAAPHNDRVIKSTRHHERGKRRIHDTDPLVIYACDGPGRARQAAHPDCSIRRRSCHLVRRRDIALKGNPNVRCRLLGTFEMPMRPEVKTSRLPHSVHYLFCPGSPLDVRRLPEGREG